MSKNALVEKTWSFTLCLFVVVVVVNAVPMDLDVKMKAVVLGSCFLIVSTSVVV